MGADPNITIQVLPFSAGAHPAMGSSFVHLRLADPSDAEIIYLEDLSSSDYLPNPIQIVSYLTVFGALSLSALDPAASTVMIKNAALGE